MYEYYDISHNVEQKILNNEIKLFDCAKSTSIEYHISIDVGDNTFIQCMFDVDGGNANLFDVNIDIREPKNNGMFHHYSSFFTTDSMKDIMRSYLSQEYPNYNWEVEC